MVRQATYFGGVFETLRYGNLSSAVKKILRGREPGAMAGSTSGDT